MTTVCVPRLPLLRPRGHAAVPCSRWCRPSQPCALPCFQNLCARETGIRISFAVLLPLLGALRRRLFERCLFVNAYSACLPLGPHPPPPLVAVKRVTGPLSVCRHFAAPQR